MVCNLCGAAMLSNAEIDETIDHKHISLQPFDISKSTIVWQDKKHAMFQVRNEVKEEMQLIYELCYIGRTTGADSFTCGDSLHNMTHYVIVEKNQSLHPAKIIGYIAYSTESFIINNKNRRLATVRQTTILPHFRKKGFGSFLQLKTLEIQKSKMFAVDDPNDNSEKMLDSLRASGYLRATHTTGFGGAPGFIFKVLKKPSTRLMRA